MNVVVIGAGGHAKVVVDALTAMGGHDLVGFVDADPALHHETIIGLTVLGGDEQLPRLLGEGVRGAVIGIGGNGTQGIRARIYQQASQLGFEMINVIHPRAVVSPHATLGRGVQVMANAVVNPGARIADGAIINTGAIVEHDCRIGAHSHVAPGAVLGGGVQVGTFSHIGIGATVLEGRTVGDNCMIGGAAMVSNNIEDGVTAIGIPARSMQKK